MATTIKMPQLGESVTEGTIERWLVKEGDTVEQYDPLFEVVTDKVNAEVPAEIGGTISKILIPDGETVAVGTAVAEIDAEGGGAAAEAPAAEAPGEATAGAPGEPTAGAPAEPTAEAAPAEAPAAQAAAGQPAAEPAPAVETPAPAASADDGAAEMEQGPATAPAPAPDASAAPAPAAPTPAAAAPATQVPSPAAADANGGAARMTPAVRRLVREHGIDIAALQGSGAGGRVTRDDVMAFIAKGTAAPSAPAETAAPQAAASQAAAAPAEPASTAAPAQPTAAVRAPTPAPAAAPTPPAIPAPSGGDTELPLSQMRKGIAKKMTQVKQTVPHAYTVVEVDMTNVVKWREANNMAFKAREGASLSYVAVVVKAVTETLRKHPTLNSQFADDKIILKQAMNVGIAVAVDNGLIVPVIHDADQLSISGVNARIRDISSRAHAGKLRLDELQGGTFTVNNTGWFGSVSSMPIINAPEVAILSMEAIVKRPRVMEIDGADVIAIRHMMNMTCSFDHRVLDGAQVGFFLADVRKFLEEWDANTSIG
jgi:pyruvate/2-oxoglutarate dehydrogenase complex dihydrolipoamide acyltransferase (E2) component